MRFDIILPTIGRPSLETTIQSVLAQEYKDWHLYIVADGHCVTQNKLEKYFSEKISCDMLSKFHNDYGAASRNNGISLGHSAWIAYVDDDDIWLPNHLTTLVSLGALRTDANMLRTAGRSFAWRHKSPRSSKLVRKIGPVNTQDILTVGMAHTRELFNKTTGWQPADNHDHMLWKEMLGAGGISHVTETITFEFER